MVRILVDQRHEGAKSYIEAVGLSTDTKPTENAITGSKFLEVNTGKRYLFDEMSQNWIEDTTVIR